MICQPTISCLETVGVVSFSAWLSIITLVSHGFQLKVQILKQGSPHQARCENESEGEGEGEGERSESGSSHKKQPQKTATPDRVVSEKH